MSDNAIQVKAFTKKYKDFTAVDDISFEVRRGEIFGLLGPNGAGKTSTLECLEGLRQADPGTLNIKLAPSSVTVRKKIDALDWTRIKGFSTDGRTFGDAKCIPCRIGTIACGIVVPGRTHYPEDIIEVIAPVALRRKLGVEDSDSISVEVGP
jgi:energy-coupling factor transporter ATP-binding protein EcfA2